MKIDFTTVWTILQRNLSFFIAGVKWTCLFAFVGTLIGFIIGVVVGGIRAVSIEHTDRPFVRFVKKVLLLITRFYVWVFRGTPMMVQAVFIYYLFKPVFQWNSHSAGMVVISLNTGAYMAEIIRSGIQSIDGGQLEACKSIGMSFFQSLVYVIMPQAIKNAFPSIGNEFVVNIKDTSVLNVIAITELYFQTVSIAGSNFKYIETYFITACVYLFLTTVATTVLNYVERKLDVAENSNRKMIVESH